MFVRASAAGTSAWLSALQRKQAVKVAAFDIRAAHEFAAIHRRAETSGGKRHHAKAGEAYQKIKVDRQIAAIALVERSDVLITDDGNLRTICQANGLRAMSITDLGVPDEARQRTIDDELHDKALTEGDDDRPGTPT